MFSEYFLDMRCTTKGLILTILVAVLIIGLTSFLLSLVGTAIGTAFGNRFHLKVEVWGGVILILIGAKILVEHLFFS